MNTDWITGMFVEAGVAADVAQSAALETLARMLRRERPFADLIRPRGSPRLSTHLVSDPLVSLARILGVGDEQLPFIDDEGQLSAVAFGEVLTDVGMDPVVGLAYGKVIQAAFLPADLYQPIWEMLQQEGTVVLSELIKLDFEPIRASWTDFERYSTRTKRLSESRDRAEAIKRARYPKKDRGSD